MRGRDRNHRGEHHAEREEKRERVERDAKTTHRALRERADEELHDQRTGTPRTRARTEERNERDVRDRNPRAQCERRDGDHDRHEIDRARKELRDEHVAQPHRIRSIGLPRELFRAADRSARRAAEIRHAEQHRAEERFAARAGQIFSEEKSKAEHRGPQRREKRRRDHEKPEREHPDARSTELARRAVSRGLCVRREEREKRTRTHVQREPRELARCAPPTSSTNALSSDAPLRKSSSVPNPCSAPFSEDRDLLAKPLDDFQNVTREKDRGAAFSQRAEDVFDRAARDRIDSFERLVEKEHFGSVNSAAESAIFFFMPKL